MNRLFFAILFSLVNFSPLAAQVSPQTEQNLVSPETNVDYQPLQKLLEAQQWRAANEKTGELMLEAANRELQGWIPTDQILEFACSDLKIVDGLWRQYSQGRFGFSPQLAIFLQTGNRPGRLMAIDAYERFGDEVGWRTLTNNPVNATTRQDWIIFKENINYSLDSPVGHLPQLRQAYNLTGNRLQFTTLAQRLVECNIGAQ
ncbi:MAG: GUN4 domain-containing protein [Microcystaceae cyanobacterium]